MSGVTEDPMLAAIMVFVEEMCRLAVCEATGFNPASVLGPEREAARKAFVREMEKLTQDKEG